MKRFFSHFLLVLILLSASHAAITIENTITQRVDGNTQAYLVSVANKGDEQVYDVRVQVGNWLGGTQFEHASLGINATVQDNGTLGVPQKQGSYPIFVNVTVRNYLNKDFNILSMGQYYIGEPRSKDISVSLANVSLIDSNNSAITVRNNGNESVSLDVRVLSSSELDISGPARLELAPGETKSAVFTITKGRANFNSNQQAYAILESEDGGSHYLTIVPFRIEVGGMPLKEFDKNLFLLVAGGLALLLLYSVVFRWRDDSPRGKEEKVSIRYSIGKFAFIAVILTGLLYVYENDLFFTFNENTKFALKVLWGAFMAYAIPYSLKMPAKFFGEKDKIDRILEFATASIKNRAITGFTPEIRSAILALFVKAFFFPLMLDFTIGNFWAIYYSIAKFSLSYQLFDLVFIWGFEAAMALLFFIDTGTFLVSYVVEIPFLGNRIKSVEPTFLGWFVALICYPPFTNFAHNYIPSGPGDWADFNSFLVTGVVRTAAIILFVIYVWATYALGMRSSNLTNRGIVASGPYKYVRHPAYLSKNLAWLLFALPAFSLLPFLFQGIWAAVYILRAYTEERHLSADPEYLEYKKKVPWMFIPGVW